MQVPMPDLQTVFGAQDSAAGPTHWAAAGALEQNTLLNVGPLVNKQWDDPETVFWAAMQTSEWHALAPDGDSYLGIPWTWRRPVPKSVNKLRCRIYFRSSEDSLNTNNTIAFTVWSCNRNPGVEDVLPLERFSVTESFGPVNDQPTASPGRWLEFDTLRISRTPDQAETWLGLSVEVTGSTAATQNVQVYAVTSEPFPDADTDAIGEVGLG